jgi:GNAT superfamily N-acetyltransferase
MTFSIEAYDRNYLEGITALYNAESAFEPHIAPLDPARFVELVEAKSYFDPAGLLAAVGNGQVVGWVHACVAAGSEPGHDPQEQVPRIRMVIFPRERLKVGGALVAAATAWLREATDARRQTPGGGPAEPKGEPPGSGSRPQAIEALHARSGYPFYRGLWLGGEPMGHGAMAHVQLALEVAGYKNTAESVFMTAAMPSPPPDAETAVPVELVEAAAEMKHEPMRESWAGFEPMRLRALVAGEEAGSIGWVLLPHVADRLGAPAMNIWSLGVRDAHRRKGVASALIARAMARSYAMGARFASVGTQLWNAPAHASYAKFGFSPHCVLVGRLREPAVPEGQATTVRAERPAVPRST